MKLLLARLIEAKKKRKRGCLTTKKPSDSRWWSQKLLAAKQWSLIAWGVLSKAISKLEEKISRLLLVQA